MYIEKLNLINYKCFEGKYTIEFKEGVNILVGNNGEGKSTILEGINLTLSGLLNGKYLKNEISQYLFNKNVVKKYIADLKAGGKQEILPSIEIELFINSKTPEKLKELAILKGNNNSDRLDKHGIKLEIKFDDSYLKEYEILIKDKEIITLPIEYYQMKWSSFGRDSLTSRIIPLKSILIDSSSTKYQNGSDLYISKIIKNYLDEDKKVGISQAFRQVKEEFMRSEYISKINDDLKEKIDRKKLEISVDLSTQNSWESATLHIK